MNLRKHLGAFLLLLAFTLTGFLVMGYHPGVEDDAVYLTAIKSQLNPSLFPHDAAFFQMQMRTSLFDTWMTHFVLATHIPLPWAELVWQLLTLFLVLCACYSIVRQLFPEASARWAGMALVTAMFTLPVAGTALFLVDQYLHPRAPATVLILFAISTILAGRRWLAVPLLAGAFLFHPLMGALGISFSVILTLTLSEPLRLQLRQLGTRRLMEKIAEATPVAMLIPYGWVLDPPSANWLYAFNRGHAFRLYTWEWYEWVGAIAPVLLLWLTFHIARRRGQTKLALFAAAICIYGVFQLALAMFVEGPHMPIALSTLEPMRYLHLIYIFLCLVGGGYFGRNVLRTKAWRWAVFLIVANGGMFLGQRDLFAASPHLELPGRPPANPWLEAFAWIRQNTPRDAYFALGADYMSAPDEDHHSFRALAERSQLADTGKDTSVVTKVPELATIWRDQIDAQAGWNHFQLADYERLKTKFGVGWVIVHNPAATSLSCPWHNQELAVCRIL